MTRVLPLLLFLAAAAAPAAAQDLTPAEVARVDAVVAQGLAASGTPAAEVAVVRGGRLVFTKLYGRPSEREATGPATMPFQVASNSKQFCAAALLLLAGEGKLSLDDPVAKYLPQVTGAGRITVRQLLTHTSGLRDYWPQDYSFAAMARPVSPRAILAKWAAAPLDFAPGTQWQYSNTGYVAAGLIVEKVSGRPLLAFLKERVFAPLGIAAFDQDLAVGPGFPQGYGRRALGPVRPEPPAARGWLYAAGELSMSAADFARWDVARLNRSVLTPAEWAEQETPARLADGTDTGYGLGVQVGTRGGRRFVSHTGEAVGFLSVNTVYPDQRAAVVVLTNSWSGDAFTAIARGITAAVVPATAGARPGAIAAATGDDAAALAAARAMLDGFRAGKPDRARLTPDAAYYFDARTVADYRASLAPLGAPDVAQAGPASLRGGFVLRSYRVTYPGGRTLSLSTFLEPGPDGRFEQFLVNPAG